MPLRPPGGKPRLVVSWLGLAAIPGGLVLIWLFFNSPHLARNPNPLVAAIYLGTGCVLSLWGLWAVGAEFVWRFGRLGERAARRYRVQIQREAWLYIVIVIVLFVGALLGHNNMLMLVFALMFGPLVLNAQVTLVTIKRVRVERRLPEYARVGESFSVRLALANRKRFWSSWMVVAEDAITSPREELHPAVLFACVPAQAVREAAYEVRPAHRGLYHFGPLRVTSRFPLGLTERSFEVGELERLVVFPRIGRLTDRWRKSAEAVTSGADLVASRVGCGDEEFHRLREYRAGDNPRAIHWRTTARRNELMVREFQQSHRQDLELVVDLWLPARPAPADLDRVELAVCFAASICTDQTAAGSDANVELLICGRELARSAGSGVSSLPVLLELLALAEGGRGDSLPEALRAARANPQPHVRRVLVTTRRGEAAQAISAAGDGPGDDPAWRRGRFEIFEADPASLAACLEFDGLQEARVS